MMQQRTSYLNSFVKRHEIDFKLESLRNNISKIKPMNNSSIQFQKVQINKNKTKYLEDKRIGEIERENFHLAQKIQRILIRKDQLKSNSYKEKYSKSLNGHWKRIVQSRIDQENSKLLQRLQNSKPTYSTDKLAKEWSSIKEMQKNISRLQFHIFESPHLSNLTPRRLSKIKQEQLYPFSQKKSQVFNPEEKKIDFNIKKTTPRQKFINHSNIILPQNINQHEQYKINSNKLNELIHISQKSLQNQQNQNKSIQIAIQPKKISLNYDQIKENQVKQNNTQKNIAQCSLKIDILEESQENYNNDQINFEEDQYIKVKDEEKTMKEKVYSEKVEENQEKQLSENVVEVKKNGLNEEIEQNLVVQKEQVQEIEQN